MMVKYMFILILICVLSAELIPQPGNLEIIREDFTYPNTNNLYYQDGYKNKLLVFTNNALWLIDEENDYEASPIPFSAKPTIYSRINDRQLIVLNGDTLYIYSWDSTNKPELDFMWPAPSGLTGIQPFGPYLIFYFGTTYKLVHIADGNVYYRSDIDIFAAGNPIVVSYPYIIVNTNNSLFKMYRMASGYTFYMVNYLVIQGPQYYDFKDSIFAVYRSYQSGMVPMQELNLYSVAAGNFTLFFTKDIFSVFATLHYQLNGLSHDFFALKGNYEDPYINIYDMAGILKKKFPRDYKVNLVNSKYYAYKNDIYINGTRLGFDSLYSAYESVPLTGMVIKYKKNDLVLMKYGLNDQPVMTDSISLEGAVTVKGESIFKTQGLNYIKFNIVKEKLHQKEIFSLPENFASFDYFDNYFFGFRDSLVKIFKKDNNIFSTVTFSTSFRKPWKVFYRDSCFYLSDSTKGIHKYRFGINNTTTKIWERECPSGSFDFAVLNNYLIVRENSKILLFYTANNQADPVILDSLTIPGQVIFTGLITTNHFIYLKGLTNNNSVLWKIKITEGRLTLLYDISFNGNLEPVSLTEYGERIILTGNGVNYLIKDTTNMISNSENEFLFPETYSLAQNYPNPFNPTTVISYGLQVPGRVTLKLFDLLGNEIAVLVDEEQSAGTHEYKLSTKNYKLSSGVYFYQLRAGSFVSTRKMVLIK